MIYLHNYFILIDPDWLDDKTKPRFTTPEAYVHWVHRLIRSIDHSKVGKIVLNSIKFHRKAVRIAPLAYNDTSSASADRGQSKDLIFNRSVRPFLNALSMNFPPARAYVLFTPHHYAAGGVHHRRYLKEKHDHTPTPESVLLHELVHAVRCVSEKFNSDLKTHRGLAKYDAEEEFFAVLIGNIYESELKRNIRAHHQGFYNLEKELEGSFEFFKVSMRAFQLVDRFCRENPGMTGALAKVNVPFNPFAAYYKAPQKAESYSKSEFAVNRDIGAFKSFPFLSTEDWSGILESI
jgi:hypothetical protein